jgi:hypothetical protein
MTDPVDRGRNRSETFAEFARAEGFSLSTFYKLKKLGLGPDVETSHFLIWLILSRALARELASAGRRSFNRSSSLAA